jgi:hypothetical protein
MIALAAGMLAAFVVAAPALAQATTIATTGNPGTVTATTAQLNGVVQPAEGSSAWLFQLSLNPVFSWDTESTAPVYVPGGAVEVVERLITGLASSSSYFYRVVVETQRQGQPTFTYGPTETFTTSATPSAYWPAESVATQLAVKHGKTTIPLTCQGDSGAGCTGNLDIATTAHKTVCGTTTFSAAESGKHSVLRLRLSSSCLKLLRHNRPLRVKLSAVFTSGQPSWTDTAWLTS